MVRTLARFCYSSHTRNIQCSDAVATAAGGVAAQFLSDDSLGVCTPSAAAALPVHASLPALSAPEDCCWKPPLTRLLSSSSHTDPHFIIPPPCNTSPPSPLRSSPSRQPPATYSTPPRHSACSTSQRLLGGPSTPPPQHVIRAHNWTTAPRSARSRRESRSTRLSHAGSPTLLSCTPP